MAQIFYIAANGDDNADGLSTSTPWQTLAKVTATTLQPGDQFLFRRGDTFYGNIVTPEDSNSVNITYGAYGTGAKPVITGFTAVTAWTDKGGNIWESTNPVSTLSSVNVVTFNGVSTPMGRYPKGDTAYPFLPNFLTFQAHTGTGAGASSITSSQLTDGNNWTGADVVIRMNQWTFHREVITSQSGTTLNFDGVAGDLEDGWGFFIQNDLRTLTQQNDWYYNPISKKLSVYSVGMPSGVQVSTVDTLIYFYSNVPTVTAITLDNLKLTGANTNALWVSGNLTYSVTNCDLSYAGFEAIMMYGGGIQSGTITGNTFDSNGASAIYSVGTVSNLTIANNSINMSAVISAILRNMYSSAGIEFSAPNSLVRYNTIDNSAYCGISFNGANVQVRNNFVNHSALVRGDAAGIYTGYAGNTGKVIDGNIVFNSQGNPRGARSNDYFAMGIYIDDLGNNLSVTNNTIANCRTAGLYLHNSNNMLIQGNTIYNCGAIGTEIMWANGGISMDGNGNQFANTVYSNQVLNNKVFATNQYQYALNYYAEDGGGNQVNNFGTINSNYYVKVNSASTAVKSQQTGINGTMSLASWSSLSGKDASSSEGPRPITDPNDLRFEYNATNTNKVVALDQKYIDVTGADYNTGSITLAPYSSVVLLKNGALNQPRVGVTDPASVTMRPLLPVVITSNKTKFFSNKDNLVSTSIEWQNAWINTFFTPGTVMPQSRTCPAVETFIINQTNKNTLQFIWSLEDPYDKIEVQTIINDVVTIYTFPGNTGMISQRFNNPVVDNISVNITIKVRTICNPDSIPVEYGPFATYYFAVHGDSLPVAVDDYYQVPIGFAGVLPFSLLDNDYDPDGDPIEALAGWGLFGNGSSPAVYSVDINGMVTISNAPVNMVGKQSFDYQIHNPGSDTYVTGHVFINFGEGPQAVYVIWVFKNKVTTSSQTTADAWFGFFSDPACTIPVDITALGLTITGSVQYTVNGDITTKNYSVIGKGTQMLMESNAFISVNNSPFVILTSKFTINPGSGYTAVNP